MSVRAYLIKSSEFNRLENGDKQAVKTLAGEPTFNCWHDWDLIDCIAETGAYGENGGEIYIEKERAKRKLLEVDMELKGNAGEGEQAEHLRVHQEILINILEDIERNGEEYAEYECY